MFYCEPCAKENRWPDWGRKSYGPCEAKGKNCEGVGPCFDVSSSHLANIKKQDNSNADD